MLSNCGQVQLVAVSRVHRIVSKSQHTLHTHLTCVAEKREREREDASRLRVLPNAEERFHCQGQIESYQMCQGLSLILSKHSSWETFTVDRASRTSILLAKKRMGIRLCLMSTGRQDMDVMRWMAS